MMFRWLFREANATRGILAEGVEEGGGQELRWSSFPWLHYWYRRLFAHLPVICCSERIQPVRLHSQSEGASGNVQAKSQRRVEGLTATGSPS